jgi:carboxylesterase type B
LLLQWCCIFRFRNKLQVRVWATHTVHCQTRSPFDATKYRAACVQPPNGLDPLAPTSEDCLFLNVYVPRRGNGTALAPAGTYPVMVFLHGGSWEYGDGSFVLYHGTFVASRRDVVIVAINYRLSVMGFIGSEALAGEDARGSTGNYGLQDQRSALRWVQRNIGALGGDPARVLLYGHSAGAGSTTTHLVTPESWPLISRSMSLSGPFADWTSRPLAAAEAHFDRIAAKVGCADANSKAITACMRAVPAETLLHHEANLPGFVVTYTPTVDGVELTAPPQELARQGKVGVVFFLLFDLIF